ncbi:MAG: sugar ABC transporter ATP-binding protein [Blautia sp.]|nr:sugar ABC transporter ATP-binding protein [Blautia sp.]
MKELLMEVENISKSFPGVQALKNVQFKIYAGEIHALVGENGAGKSTLMNILSGVYGQTEGRLLWQGKEVQFKDTRAPKELGIAMIHQELSLASHLNVAENIFMGRLPKNRFGLVDYKVLKEKTVEALARVGMGEEFALAKVGSMSVSQQQMVEIAKALSLHARLIIMDEPSSSLTQNETKTLLRLIRELRDQNVAVIYISHRMDEVFEIAERITILRDGSVVGSSMAGEVTVNQVLSTMVGREYKNEKLHQCRADYAAEPVLKVENLTYKNIVKGVSFEVYPSEILAVTGLVGAGRTELLECVVGFRRADSGEVFIKGKKADNRSVSAMMKNGLAMVPEGRKIKGILPQMSVLDNMRISALGNYTHGGIIQVNEVARKVNEKIEELRVKTPSVQQKMKYLSGGNQQKVIVGRCLMCTPEILVMDEPTNGIDVGAKQEIYKIIDDLSRQGIAVICISSEMAEVMAIADRVIVMHEGVVTGNLKNENLSQDTIMQYASNQVEQAEAG